MSRADPDPRPTPGLRWWIPPLLAVQFLTRLPVAGLPDFRAAAPEPGASVEDGDRLAIGLSRAIGWYPLVGSLVGALSAACLLVVDHLWPRVVAVVIALIVDARMTGCFHEDAVADFCDGFGGGQTPERIHAIMTDSRVGSFGSMGLMLAVALRGALLMALPTPLIPAALVGAGAFGRFVAVAIMALTPPHKGESGTVRLILTGLRRGDVVMASGWTVLCLIPLAFIKPAALLLALPATMLFLWWQRRLILRRLGGITGDCAGFAAYAGQLILLLAITARIG